MVRWFSNHDILLLPTLATTAVLIGKWRGQGWVRTTMGFGNWLLTTPWNLARFPAMSVPAGISCEGLPLAIQLVGFQARKRYSSIWQCSLRSFTPGRVGKRSTIP
jgi:amidase